MSSTLEYEIPVIKCDDPEPPPDDPGGSGTGPTVPKPDPVPEGPVG